MNKKKKTRDVNIVCSDCGKPIVYSDEYGMFCEDRCGYEQSKQIEKTLSKFVEWVTGEKKETDIP